MVGMQSRSVVVAMTMINSCVVISVSVTCRLRLCGCLMHVVTHIVCMCSILSRSIVAVDRIKISSLTLLVILVVNTF